MLDETHPFFDLEFDPTDSTGPSTVWIASHGNQPRRLRGTAQNPWDWPHIGAADQCVQRALASISDDTLRNMGVCSRRAKYFITCGGKFYGDIHFHEDNIKNKLRCMENPKPLYPAAPSSEGGIGRLIYLYDGSFDGFLCCVYAHYVSRERLRRIDAVDRFQRQAR